MYTNYFGFREAPFSVTPEPRFFYTNALYLENLAALRYGIGGKKGFTVITGEAGTGKTTLLRKLMRDLEANIHPVFIFNTNLSFIGLLRLILRDLGLANQDKDESTMIEQLNSHLIEQAKRGHIVALLIDEAQNLNDETLEGLTVLSNLETDREKLLQIVLAGEPELEEKLDRPSLRQLKQRAAVQGRLLPLNGSEVSPYIDLRLQAAGYEGEELFDRDAIDRIASYSGGNPRLINIICDNALLLAYARSQKRVSTEMIREVAQDMGLELRIQAEEAEAPGQNKDENVGASHSARVRIWTALLPLALAVGASFIYTMHAKNRFAGVDVKVEEERIVASGPGNSEKIRTPAGPKSISESGTEPQEQWFASPISRPDEPEKIQIAAGPESFARVQSKDKWWGSPIFRPDESEQIRTPAEAESFSAELDEILSIMVPAQAKGKKKIYRVKQGDHLYAILRKQFGIEGNQEMHDALNRVKELNSHKKNWDVLFAGEVLVFPGEVASLRK